MKLVWTKTTVSASGERHIRLFFFNFLDFEQLFHSHHIFRMFSSLSSITNGMYLSIPVIVAYLLLSISDDFIMVNDDSFALELPNFVLFRLSQVTAGH